VTPIAKYLLPGLVALVPAAAEACPVETDGNAPADRPTISRSERTVLIEQADRLVIVMAGERRVEQVRTLGSATAGAGRVQITIAPDSNGEGGAIVLVDDRGIQATGDAVIESIPHRSAGAPAPCSEADGDIVSPDLGGLPSTRVRVVTEGIIDRAKAVGAYARQVIDTAVAIAGIARATIDRPNVEAAAWIGKRR
jgi:hypothetical protein